jgi:polyisoprenoid-binding protein YceI
LEASSVVCRDPAIKPEKRREIVSMMKNQLLACESNGHVTFDSTRIQRKEGSRYIVEGNIGFRGAKKPASFELTLVKLGADRLEVDGSAQLKLSDFGVTPPSGVKDEVQVRVLLWPERAQLRRAAS